MKSLLAKTKSLIRDAFPDNSPAGQTNRELKRLMGLPRYVATTTDLLGPRTSIPDGPSFAVGWKAIFRNNIYQFSSENATPRILDCGANVGLACVYFKKILPRARITAFEADPKIFTYLKGTLDKLAFTDIELVQKAVWSSNTTLRFKEDGADAGRIEAGSTAKTIEVEAVRLKNYLAEPIDLLKIDIEGAETEVLADCAACLPNVQRIFVEYHSFAKSRQTVAQLFGILEAAGFRVHVHPEIISPSPFMSIDEYLGMDLQLNIFAYRNAGAR